VVKRAPKEMPNRPATSLANSWLPDKAKSLNGIPGMP